MLAKYQRDHSFSTSAKFSGKLTYLTSLIRTRFFAYYGIRNVRFSKNFAYTLNKQSQRVKVLSSVIRQKGESQNECFKKAKHANISEKQTCVCVSGGKKCLFFGNFGVLCFQNTCFEIRHFALFPTKKEIKFRNKKRGTV